MGEGESEKRGGGIRHSLSVEGGGGRRGGTFGRKKRGEKGGEGKVNSFYSCSKRKRRGRKMTLKEREVEEE